MGQNLRCGQFYRDMVNGDLLKILGFTFEVDTMRGPVDTLEGVEYVRCACIVHGKLFGPQEMRSSHLHNAERFSRVSIVRELWLRWKFRNSQLKSSDIPQLPQEKAIDQKSTY